MSSILPPETMRPKTPGTIRFVIPRFNEPTIPESVGNVKIAIRKIDSRHPINNARKSLLIHTPSS
jgi:hypothetical protein